MKARRINNFVSKNYLTGAEKSASVKVSSVYYNHLPRNFSYISDSYYSLEYYKNNGVFMRKTILLILILLSTLAFTSCMSFEQTDPALLNQPFSYIIEIPEKSEDELFTLAKLWIANTYNSAESVITFEDSKTGTVKGSAIGSVKVPGDMFRREFRYNISIESKESRIRIQFSNISPNRYYAGTNAVAGVDIRYKANYDAVNFYFDDLSLNFEESFTNTESSDW